MLLDLAGKRSFFQLLHRIDQDLADEHRRRGCAFCGGPLHQANYLRKPRGGLVEVEEAWELRLSFCCGREGCRRRNLPPSALFMGRRVYWGFVALLLTTLRQGRETGTAVARLKQRLGVDRKTLRRWVVWFEEVFPLGSVWKSLRGRLVASVGNQRLPTDLVHHFLAAHEEPGEAVAACLRFLGSGVRARSMRDGRDPQKMTVSAESTCVVP